MSLTRPCLLMLSMALLAAGAVRATAAELRDFCPNRPGLGTPTCIVDTGHFVVETGVVDWTRETGPASETDTVLLGNLLLRYGLNETLEAEIGWDGYGYLRSRDRATRQVDRSDGAGDMSFALRQNIMNPDGSGTSVSVMPFLKVPTGSDDFGAGDWGAGMIVPISFEVSKGVRLALSPEIDAAVDSDGNGRHVAFGSVVGLGFSLTAQLGMTLEISLARDDDPEGASTQALTGLSFAWKPKDDLQFDLGLVAGLNANSPDAEVSAGIARRF